MKLIDKNNDGLFSCDQQANDDCRPSFDFDKVWDFIIKVGLAAHRYGSTSTRIEAYLSFLANSMGYRGVFKSNPSEIMFSLYDEATDKERIKTIAVNSDVDLSKLAKLGKVLTAIKSGEITLEQAGREIDIIEGSKPEWTASMVLLGYVFVGFGLPAILGGSWLDTTFATLFSVITFCIVSQCSIFSSKVNAWVPFFCTCIIGSFTAGFNHFFPSLNNALVIVSSTAIILPGYSISLGVGELLLLKLRSGGKNLFNGVICLLKMILGSWVGISIVRNSLSSPLLSSQAIPVDKYWLILMFPLLMFGLCVVFQTAKKDMLWVLVISSLAFIVYFIAGHVFNVYIGVGLSTILSVMIANSWAQLQGYSSSIILIPVIVMLVSGTIGYRGLFNIVDGNTALGYTQVQEMLLVAVTMLICVTLGHLIVKPTVNI